MIEIAPTGKHAQHEDFHLGIHGIELPRDCLHPISGLLGFVATPADIVSPDHQRGGFGQGLESGKVFESPQNVICPVSAKSQIQGV